MQEVKLSPLTWENFKIPPKLMKISNSGTTAILSAKWNAPRPFICNGPISGKYVFSQLHFHWGRTFQEGSEHRVNGESLPLEVHAMFFKHVYVSQEDAMKRNDGNITIAYFFKLQNDDNENLNPITDVLHNIKTPMSSEHITCRPLEEFVPPFTEDYFLYWGRVVSMNVLWLICRKPLGISHNQLSLFQKLIGMDKKPIQKNFREPTELNHRKVFHVNPSANKEHPLLPVNPDSVYTDLVVPTHEEEHYTVLENEQVRKEIVRGLSQEGEMNLLETEAKKERDEEGDIKSGYAQDVLKFHLKKNTNVSELKYALAKALLELEKNENNDYGVLENYLKSKQVAAQAKLKKNSSQSNVVEEELKKPAKEDKENEKNKPQSKMVYENSAEEVEILDKENSTEAVKDKLPSEYETGDSSITEDTLSQSPQIGEDLPTGTEMTRPLVEEIYENVKHEHNNPLNNEITYGSNNPNSGESDDERRSACSHEISDDPQLTDKITRKTVVLTDKKELQKTFTILGNDESDTKIKTDDDILKSTNESKESGPPMKPEEGVKQVVQETIPEHYKEKLTRIRRKFNNSRQADRLSGLTDGKDEFQPRATSRPGHRPKSVVMKRSKSSGLKKTPEQEQRLFTPTKNERKLQGRIDVERRRQAIRRSLSRITRQMTPKEDTMRRLSTAERPKWKP